MKKVSRRCYMANENNAKWYGALLLISERKLGLKSDKIPEIIDLRYQKESIKIGLIKYFQVII